MVTSKDASIATGATVRLDGVCFQYPNGVAAVDELSLDIASNTSVAIVGPSGCGKSTILSLVADLLKAKAGRISISGGDPQRHPVTMVFQKDTLLPWLPVRDNVMLYCKFAKRGSKRDRAALNERVRNLLAIAHLSDFERSYPYELSGGMRRRAAFLAGVAPLPRLLLLDEPFSALDEPSRVALHQDVHEIVRSSGITTMLVTHDLAEAISLSDKVYILTSRPARVFRAHDIPFGRERDIMSLREQRDFLDLYGLLWRDLHSQINAGPREPEPAAPRSR
jgi:ABC-type nitrate/sulfonate/bicarbonate transport system ATPase subunit